MQEDFTVPECVSTKKLKTLSSKIKANKRERIIEYLQYKKLPCTIKNVKKALLAIEDSILNGNLNLDYSELSLEQEFKNKKDFRQKLIDSMTECFHDGNTNISDEEISNLSEDMLEQVFGSDSSNSGFVLIDSNSGEFMVISINYIIKCLNLYKNEGNKIDVSLEKLLNKNEDELDNDEESDLMDFFGLNEDFLMFCIKHKLEEND